MLPLTHHPLTRQITAAELDKMTQEDIDSLGEFTEADLKKIVLFWQKIKARNKMKSLSKHQ